MVAVRVERVSAQGLTGVLCTPDGAGPAPGVLLLGGSEGGLHERDARLLAAEGFTVLALAYFGAPGTPSALVDVPLEHFVAGLDLLAAKPRTEGVLGALGGSRGAEAALLVAAHDERVSAVVSIAGSGIVTQGIDYAAGPLPKIIRTPAAAWTLDGTPLPYLPYMVPERLDELAAAGEPVPLALAFRRVPRDPAELERVSIPVERIRGRVLSVCGADDLIWPSAAYTQVAVDRLAAHGRAHAIEHRVLPRVGHPIAGAPSRSFRETTSPGPGVTFALGGTPAANTEGRATAWGATLDFFHAQLRGESTLL